jgi:hypothetical protein
MPASSRTARPGGCSRAWCGPNTSTWSVWRCEQVDQQVALARAVDRMHAVGDGLGDGVLRRHLDLLRVVHELQRQLLDLRLEGGREQQGLALLRQRLRTRLIAGRKPMSSMRSASSSTSTLDRDRSTLPRSRWSIRRPGQATSTSTPRRSCSICGCMPTPPNSVVLELQVTAVGLEAVGDLHRQFAGRHQHQRARLARAGRRGFLAGTGGSAPAARTRRSCRCRSGRRPARRGRTAPAGWPGPGSGSGWCSRCRRARAATRAQARGIQTSFGNAPV